MKLYVSLLHSSKYFKQCTFKDVPDNTMFSVIKDIEGYIDFKIGNSRLLFPPDTPYGETKEIEVINTDGFFPICSLPEGTVVTLTQTVME